VFRYTRWRRIGDALVSLLIRLGVVPNSYILTTTGRKSGLPRSNPVTVVDLDGRRWLVAPYGPVSWVHNARAAGEVTLTRRSTTVRYAVREASAQEAGPVLKGYLKITGPPRAYFTAKPDDPPQAFAAEAHLHPVFELV
jgi:deazaflavin-dependent oxidoreductase (nitroreductase family)